MGSGQSNQNQLNNQNHQSSQNNQEHVPEQQTLINSSVALRSQALKKRMISQDDDDDDDDDDEEEEQDSNEDSENDEQQFESKKKEEYVIGDKLVENKSMYSGYLLNRTQLLAIKKIALNNKENFKIIKYNLQQLANLRHQNLEPIISWNFENSNNKKNYYLNVFSNFQSNGSLQSIISKYCKFSQELVLTIFQSILKALDYLHSQNKLHRNLKTSNVLVDPEGTILISDILIQSQYSLSNYSAPEAFEYADYSEASDIWSAGCIVYELITKRQPWQTDERVLSIQEIKRKYSQNQLFFNEKENIQRSFLLILQQIFSFNPQERPSASQLLKNQIFVENSQNKFKQVLKQTSQKEMQKKPQQQIMSLIQNFEHNNNVKTPKPFQFVKMIKKEDDETQFHIKECVLSIQSNTLKEFTVQNNSSQFSITKSLCSKQGKFGTNLIQQQLCQNKQSSRVQEAQNLLQFVSQMKTAINFQGSNVESQNSVSDKNFDLKSVQRHNLILQSEQSVKLENQQKQDSQQIQDQKVIKSITESIQKEDLINPQAEAVNHQKENNLESEQIFFDGDFVFIL
ncbi:unnamed protein product (macronuclear) [Paramecium tetraurelia]|uniref:Protein kinase domain-containing protein n=1 Tax=Paramecium tetraurelia TaxID=5888 RepID=A0DLG8_PARTE|nr:uncharacterized protein GSPATT00018202001 [Paramecium tetraurelia]CAK83885.1 unnamed protein product [Paramecium tetraurelia]|eukprot:XP_001451282.1 hypothetical protein (macronuclear) [Paramecium tetraurelia strain d4-2]